MATTNIDMHVASKLWQ